jgi:hypothetical protein
MAKIIPSEVLEKVTKLHVKAENIKVSFTSFRTKIQSGAFLTQRMTETNMATARLKYMPSIYRRHIVLSCREINI